MATPSVTQTPALPAEVPVLPLRQTVVFPLTLQPLAVNRPVSVESINRALATDRMVLLALQEGEAEEPQPDDLQRVGTVGIVRQMVKAPTGLHVIVEGLARVEALSITRDGNVMRATIVPRPEQIEQSLEVDA